jgi:hypothetical protein
VPPPGARATKHLTRRRTLEPAEVHTTRRRPRPLPPAPRAHARPAGAGTAGARKAIGISSLPDQRAALAEQIERSTQAFGSADDASGEESYLFVLEDGDRGGALAGTAGIAAAAGFNDRFYCYRNEFIVQAAPALGARNRIHTLHLCHDLTGVTLLTGFHIDAAYAGTLAPQLLSRGRLLFIAAHAARFSTASRPRTPAWPTTAAAARSGTPWAGASWTCPMPRPNGCRAGAAPRATSPT